MRSSLPLPIPLIALLGMLSLIALFFLMRSIIVALSKRKIQRENRKNLEKRKEKERSLALSQQTREKAIPPEIIAVLTATICAFTDPGKAPIIRKITRMDPFSPAWRKAGILQNSHLYSRRPNRF